MSSGRTPAVSVTIVLHNSEQGLVDCIRSIRAELDAAFAELIPVDNASPDGSVAVIEREAPTAQIVRSADNRGFAAGANLAWPHVRGLYWVLLNPDVVLDPGGLRELAAWMDAHPRIGVASADIRREDGSGPHAAGRALPTTWRKLLEASRLQLLLPRGLRGRILRGAYWTGGDQLDAGWVPGTAMIARRDAVEAVGLLNENFFLYGEDIEWCWRMRRRGWAVGVCSRVEARHRESSSASETLGEPETRARMVAGEIAAVASARGQPYARRYARATAFGFWLEAINPRRTRRDRLTARAAAAAWRAAFGEQSR
jgi:GT2 family glycosyltransferase